MSGWLLQTKLHVPSPRLNLVSRLRLVRRLDEALRAGHRLTLISAPAGMGWIFWAFVIAAIVHIVEEYFGGWLNWTRRYMPGVTLAQFVVINVIFVIGCLIAAIVGERNLVVGLSIASLLLVNALIHLLPAIVMRRYTPSSAILVSKL